MFLLNQFKFWFVIFRYVIIMFLVCFSFSAGPTAFADEIAPVIQSVPFSSLTFHTEAPSIYSQVNLSPNLLALTNIGEFAFVYKTPLIITSTLFTTLAATFAVATVFIPAMYDDPFILTLPELTPHLTLLSKVKFVPQPLSVPIIQATFLNAESLFTNKITSPFLWDLLNMNPRVGVDIDASITMPHLIQAYTTNYWPGDSLTLTTFRDTSGFNYDVFKRVTPIYDAYSSQPTVSAYWINHVREITVIENIDKCFFIYNGEVALIPFGETNYVIYHHVDVVKPIFDKSFDLVLEPSVTFFVKDHFPHNPEDYLAAKQFFHEITKHS